ncbi:MAG: HAD family phosphatase [Oscillospiraceae bacterium]|nr:HAD family phosphatase [Oscillospiraceae bacterium]
MKPRLIAFDLDGTLLNTQKHIPQENKDALIAAAEEGVILVPATGRILGGMPEELMELGLFRYFIFSNGAEIYDLQERRRIQDACIPTDLALRICDYMDTLPVLYDFYRGETGYMQQEMHQQALTLMAFEPYMVDLIRRLRVPVPDIREEIKKHPETPLEKMQMYFRLEDMDLREKQMIEVPRRFPDVMASSSVKNNLEINSVKAGKGQALLAICRLLEIPEEASMAFGDGRNDAELLKMAGCGVAMANAHPSVLEVADRVTENNDKAGVGKEIFRCLKEE